jgi:iron(III) transport system ATP-binding protein
MELLLLREVAVMSVEIRIKHAVKKYGNQTIINDLNLDVKEGEFFTLLGPSGCGKTTLLRMIAGFNTIEGGDFYFNDNRINDLDPSKRNIGMVFQNYAIFPNMTVRKNVEFGLKNQKISKEEIASRANEFLKLMQIDMLADRMPERLSGGQQQRVALARALCIKPHVLLMDEPLSNLDAKLRVEMRTVIKEIQNNIGITTIYVTHDQEEAMAVSDRIAVMKGGVIQQIGTPKNIYQRPANIFVASFIGRSNTLDGAISMVEGKPHLLLGGLDVIMTNVRKEQQKNQKVLVSVRPEELLMSKTPTKFTAVVDDGVFLGLNTHYFMHLPDKKEIESIRESTIESTLKKGAVVSLDINAEKINIFTADGSENILEGVVNDNVYSW